MKEENHDRNIIFDNNFEVAVKPVMTRETTSYGSNTTLRIKNVNSDFSSNYKDAVGISNKPVVLSKGIHSNLLSWQNFGKDLAGKGFDVWLIEMVGGPYTDDTSSSGCGSNCPNYTFADLKDYYWPALIAGVQEYSGKNKVDYVGFSLGCSAALESLESHQNGVNNTGYYFDYNTGKYLFSDLAANPVDTFVGVGCPGNFTKLTSFMKVLNMTKDDVFELAAHWGLSHLTGGKLRQLTYLFRDDVQAEDPDLYKRLDWASLYLTGFILDDGKMSINIYDDFYDWMNDPVQPNLGTAVQLNNTLLVQGKAGGLSPYTMGIINASSIDQNSDLIVPSYDMKKLCDNLNSTNKYYTSFNKRTHGGLLTSLPKDSDVKTLIRDFLKYKTVENDPAYESNNNCGVI